MSDNKDQEASDKSFYMNQLQTRAALALGLDPENTSWFEIVGELERGVNCPITHILGVSKDHCTLNKSQIQLAITEEVGELATEVAIEAGYKDRKPSFDGVIGESVDVIIAAVDMIYASDQSITVKDINTIVKEKCKKWASKSFKSRHDAREIIKEKLGAR